MKKLILTTALVSTVILAGASNASAAEVKKADTEIGIEFDGTGTEIVDGPYLNRLTLVYKPSAFQFKKAKALGVTETHDAVATDGPRWLVVNDDRNYTDNAAAGTEAQVPGDVSDVKGGTWVLKATMSDLKAGSETVPAKLSLALGEVKSYDIGTTLNAAQDDLIPNPADAPYISDFAPGADHKVKVLTPALELEAGDGNQTAIMNKDTADGEKIGVATEVTDVKLQTTAGTKARGKAFQSKVTWTLYTGIL